VREQKRRKKGEKENNKNMKGKLALIVDGLVGDQSDLFPTLRLHPKGKKKANARWLMLFPYTRHYFFFLVSFQPLNLNREETRKKNNNKATHPFIHPSCVPL
jgi:hypothetical protein